jgi:alpha-beta hydrolase superfamily lysophospholipase
MVTRDADHARAINNDPLRIRKMTVRLFVESESAQEQARARASELSLPLYCRAAELDKIASLDATRRFMSAVRSSDKQLEVALGQYHELHQEPEWTEHATILLQHFERWCAERESALA